MNGWRRLWVVACFFIASAWVLFGIEKMTTQSDLDSQFQDVKESYESRERQIQQGVAPRESLFDRTHGAKTMPELWQGLRKEQESYRAKSDELGMQQLKQAGFLLIAWAVSCGLLYGAGWTVAWVFRGFKPKKG